MGSSKGHQTVKQVTLIQIAVLGLTDYAKRYSTLRNLRFLICRMEIKYLMVSGSMK